MIKVIWFFYLLRGFPFISGISIIHRAEGLCSQLAVFDIRVTESTSKPTKKKVDEFSKLVCAGHRSRQASLGEGE